MDNQKELIKALVSFQSEVGTIKKEKVNPFFKSKYADLSMFIDVCRPVLAKCKLAVTQTTKYTDGIIILITTLCHESGQSISSEYPLLPVKTDPQSLGAAMTYARRYSYSAILNVTADDEDDDGNSASNTNGNNGSNGYQNRHSGAAPPNTSKPVPVKKPEPKPESAYGNAIDSPIRMYMREMNITEQMCNQDAGLMRLLTNLNNAFRAKDDAKIFMIKESISVKLNPTGDKLL